MDVHDKMSCLLCGQSGEGSDNQMLTMECNHTFHTKCLPDDKRCIVCNNDSDTCSICFENVDTSVEPLAGCIHRFHPSCIIPYFRTSGSNGACPVCRRNPHENTENAAQGYDSDDDGEEESDNDSEMERNEITRSLIGIVNSQRKLGMNIARRKNISDKSATIKGRLEKARQARIKDIQMRKKTINTKKYKKWKNNIEKSKKDIKRLRKEILKNIKIRKRNEREIRRSIKKPKRSMHENKIQQFLYQLAESENPLWKYEISEGEGEYSENMTLKQLLKLDISDDTNVHHPGLGTKPFRDVKHAFRRMSKMSRFRV